MVVFGATPISLPGMQIYVGLQNPGACLPVCAHVFIVHSFSAGCFILGGRRMYVSKPKNPVILTLEINRIVRVLLIVHPGCHAWKLKLARRKNM